MVKPHWVLLLPIAQDPRRATVAAFTEFSCRTEETLWDCLISLLMDRWWWCGRDNTDVISSSNRLVFICPALIPPINCSDVLLFMMQKLWFWSCEVKQDLWGECLAKQHQSVACILNILVMFLCEASQSCLRLCFCTDQKPTVVKDGHLLCPAPVLHEVGQ